MAVAIGVNGSPVAYTILKAISIAVILTIHFVPKFPLGGFSYFRPTQRGRGSVNVSSCKIIRTNAKVAARRNKADGGLGNEVLLARRNAFQAATISTANRSSFNRLAVEINILVPTRRSVFASYEEVSTVI